MGNVVWVICLALPIVSHSLGISVWEGDEEWTCCNQELQLKSSVIRNISCENLQHPSKGFCTLGTISDYGAYMGMNCGVRPDQDNTLYAVPVSAGRCSVALEEFNTDLPPPRSLPLTIETDIAQYRTLLGLSGVIILLLILAIGLLIMLFCYLHYKSRSSAIRNALTATSPPEGLNTDTDTDVNLPEGFNTDTDADVVLPEGEDLEHGSTGHTGRDERESTECSASHLIGNSHRYKDRQHKCELREENLLLTCSSSSLSLNIHSIKSVHSLENEQMALRPMREVKVGDQSRNSAASLRLDCSCSKWHLASSRYSLDLQTLDGGSRHSSVDAV